MVDPIEKSLIKKDSGTTGKGIERAREILDAAREIFARQGYAAVSMRSIAAHVGVSLSTVQHYYKNKEALFEALLLYMMDTYQKQIDAVTRAMASADRTAQFMAAMDIFLADIKNPMTSGVFVEIWALANRHPYAARIMETIHARERKAISRLIRNLVPSVDDKDLDIRAILIPALIDGLLLRVARKSVSQAEIAQLEEAGRRAFVLLAKKA
ncbi:MAG: TetR/AcrR family transcriptional regulator [Proteobacteria bacterium]|nr:TetR/AcrR family transcriptional regulator [Pseudomonadota bacterium]